MYSRAKTRTNRIRTIAPFCLWRALDAWRVCSEWKMCLHSRSCSTILFSWKNTRFRSTRQRTRKHGNWRQGLFLLLMIIVFFLLPLSLSFFLYVLFSVSIALRVFPFLIFMFFPSFFLIRFHKILRAPQRFFHLIARIECLFNDNISDYLFSAQHSVEKSRVVTSRIRVRHSNSEATTCRFNRQRKVITWLRYENTSILRSRTCAFPFASVFARMRRVFPKSFYFRIVTLATSRRNWINTELKGISGKTLPMLIGSIQRSGIRNSQTLEKLRKITIPYLLCFYCLLWTRITTCVAYASQSIGKTKRIVDTCVWQRRKRRGFWSLKGEEGGGVEREDK